MRTPPLPHQVDGTAWIKGPVPGRVAPAAALFDIMGSGKSKQVVDAACELFEVKEINTVVVFCPAAVKFSWADPDLGQVAQHGWVPTVVVELKSEGDFVPDTPGALTWVVVSYDWARSKRGLEKLRQELQGRKLLMVADESHRLGNHRAETTRVLTDLRDSLGGRGVLLSGTPMTNRYVLSLYSQFRWLDKRILPFQNFYHFRARFCQLGGPHNRVVLRYFDLDFLDRLLRPYVLRRTDVKLPKKTYQQFEVPLTPATWKLYREMRDEMVAWLSDQPGDQSVAVNGFEKILRLAQLTSGILGGLDGEDAREISAEKNDFLLGWFRELKDLEEPVRFVVWCRFRPELPRLLRGVAALGIRGFRLAGGQSPREREEAIREFQQGDPGADAVLAAQPQAGGAGLNFSKCHREVFVSHVHALLDRQQAEDRLSRLDSVDQNLQIWDLLATGPAGQKTIDHLILKNMRAGVELHRLTMAQWRKSLTEE